MKREGLLRHLRRDRVCQQLRRSICPRLRGQRVAPRNPDDAPVVNGVSWDLSRGRRLEASNFPDGDFRPTALPKGEIRSTFRVARYRPGAAKLGGLWTAGSSGATLPIDAGRAMHLPY
jgi:hypothetical protein